MHENFDRDEKISRASERTFGLTLGAAAVVVALLPLLRAPAGPVKWWLLVIGCVLVVLGLVWPKSLVPLNKAWLKLGLLLYGVVSPITLALLFYACVAPIGWIMRTTGKDPLRLRLDRASNSYWLTRESPPGSMKNQF